MTEPLLQAYLQHIKFERGLSALTSLSYARDIALLYTLIQKNNAIPQQAFDEKSALTSLKNVDIRRMLATLHSRGLNEKSIARVLSSWRGFFKFLTHHKNFTANPTQGLKAPKAEKKLPQTLSTDQAVHFVNIEGVDFLSVRDHAILELFYSSGLRLSELVNLTQQDLDFTDGIVTVTGKGNKTRAIPMGSHAMAAIRQWQNIRQMLKIAPEHQHILFLTKNGTPMTPRAVQYRFKYWATKKHMLANMYPHLLRHSFASHVLQSSQDLRGVQEMLGHANISTTQVYTHLDFQHLALIYDKSHPRAQKKQSKESQPEENQHD